MRIALLALLFLTAADTAHAQAENKANPPAPIRQPGPPQMVAPGTPPSTKVIGRDLENAGTGANATITHSGTGADTVTTDSAVGGNAEHQTRAVPQEGGAGGSGNGGS